MKTHSIVLLVACALPACDVHVDLGKERGTDTGVASTTTTGKDWSDGASASEGEPGSEGINDEEKTDGMTDSGSSGEQVPEGPLRIFTTREAFTADFHGIDGADATCQEVANSAGLEGTFIAWLSTYEQDAIDRVGGGPWDRIDGVRVFEDPTDLVDEALAPLNVDEYGEVLPDALQFVWTGTGADGKRAVTPNCVGGGVPLEWNADEPGPYGAAFAIPDVLEEWTNSSGALECHELAHLYCFEVRP